MSEIILLAESGSDINPETAAKYNITIVPMHVTLGNKTYDDGAITPKEIFDHYFQTGELPKTSGSTLHDFQVALDRLHAEHPNARILHLAYSAVTTCAYQNALLAAEGRDYYSVVDTRMVTIGQASIVIRTAEIYQAHPEYTVEQLMAEAEKLIRRSRLAFVTDTLKFLHAGGRVSNAAFLAGSILKIHPRIELLDGKLVGTKKYRGSMEKVIPALIQEYTAEQNLERDRLWFLHAEGLTEEQKMLAESTAKELGFREIVWMESAGVITSHGGPGCFAIAGFTAE